MKLKRREFLKISSGVMTGAAFSGILGVFAKKGPAAGGLDPLRKLLAGSIEEITSVCGACSGGCGIKVRVVDDLPVFISGNPLHPLNRTGLCPRGAAGLQELYDPDRLSAPLVRKGERGGGKWKQVPWEEAIKVAAERLGEIHSAGKANNVMIWSGPERGTLASLIRRFGAAYGTKRVRIENPPHTGPMITANYLTQGIARPIAYDFEHTRFILSFGAPLLDGWWSPVSFARAYGRFRSGKPGAKLVQVSPRFDVTAVKADEWVRIRPGTEAALAMAIGRVLVKEELYDREFVQQHASGFEDWKDADGREHTGYKSLLLGGPSLDKVSRLTGVPISVITRLAKEFAAAAPAVATGESSCTNAARTLMCVHALNALAGSIDVPGGVVVPDEVPLRMNAADDNAHLRAGELSGEVPEALILVNSNPAFSHAQSKTVRNWLEKTGFLISCTPVLDESSMMADLVLPDHTYFEKWQDDPVPPAGKWAVFGLRKPVIEPMYDTMHAGDVLIRIAGVIGGDPGKDIPWKDFYAMMAENVAALAEVKRGTLFQPASDEAWSQQVADRGWMQHSFSGEKDFWKKLSETGGWWDPGYSFGEWDRVFRTPGRKFSFYSELLAESAPPDAEDVFCLPHYEEAEVKGDEKEYPFKLHIFRTVSLGEGRQSNLPFIQEFPDPQSDRRWDSWVEIGAEAAHRMGIPDGRFVWVESGFGKVKTRARLVENSLDDVVSMPFGQGHSAMGRYAKMRGVNPLVLLPEVTERLSGAPAWDSVRVRISKA